MDVDLPKGTYVVAVSGGVDSMVLLDLLARQGRGAKIIVAHFDHGIRDDSATDRKLVQQIAEKYDLPFVYDEGRLGMGASEAAARKARYDFLHRVREAAGADAIVTAHHQDDMLETAIINVLRGTGRRGLSSLQSKDRVLRPLLHLDKKALVDYAQMSGLHWREDTTNQDETYLRNYVRRKILNKFSKQQRHKLLEIIEDARQLNHEIDHLLTDQLHLRSATHTLDRSWFIGLPHAVAREFMAEWLRGHGIRQFDRKLLEKLVHAAKTYHPGKRIDVNSRYQLAVYKHQLVLVERYSE